MDALLEVCAGLDVHEKTIVACVLEGGLQSKPHKEVRTFESYTEGLLQLCDWLEEKKCTHVVMESTGVYWKPVWNILESGSFELILANARQVKNLPGRKTDVNDAQWLAQLLRSGLINKSFVPEQPIRDLRDLTRYRKKLMYGLNSEKNRIHKILQDCNIKLTSYISDVFGDTGTKILLKLMNGDGISREDVDKLIQGRGKWRLQNKGDDIYKSLNGKVREHHRQMLRYSYNHILFMEKQIEEVEMCIDKMMGSFREEQEILESMPGISKKASAVLIAEIGADMNQFPSDRHLSSWAGLSPGNNESAGKKKEVIQ